MGCGVGKLERNPRRHPELVSGSISYAAAYLDATLLGSMRVSRTNQPHGLWILKQVQDDGGEACISGQLRAASHPHAVMLNLFQHPYPLPLLALPCRCSINSRPARQPATWVMDPETSSE
jgi:hypothetical protein